MDNCGGGVSQTTILSHKPYLVNKEGVKNTQKFDHVVYGWPLINQNIPSFSTYYIGTALES